MRRIYLEFGVCCQKALETLLVGGDGAVRVGKSTRCHDCRWHTDRGGEPLFGWRRRYWSFLLKLAKSAPAWTVQAQPGPATGLFHWDNRLWLFSEIRGAERQE